MTHDKLTTVEQAALGSWAECGGNRIHLHRHPTNPQRQPSWQSGSAVETLANIPLELPLWARGTLETCSKQVS